MRTLIVGIAVVLGMVLAREAGGRSVLGGCDRGAVVSTSLPGQAVSGACSAGDPAKARLLAFVGGVAGAVIGVPLSWPLTRRPGEPFWAPDPD